MALSPAAATKPTSAVWPWRWPVTFHLRSRMVSHRSAPHQLSMPPKRLTTRSTSQLDCLDSVARRCAGFPSRIALQLDVDALQKAIRHDRAAGSKPFCVVATAGTTNSGAIDDIPAIAEICRHEQLWLHLDGAYGASAVFSDTHRSIVRGIEQCDSVTIDPHKWLAMPFAAGVILTRHPQTLQQAFGVSTPYMPKTASHLPPDNFKVSSQWTRRMNSLKLWLTLKAAWPAGLRAAHRPPDESGLEFRRLDQCQRAFRAGGAA